MLNIKLRCAKCYGNLKVKIDATFPDGDRADFIIEPCKHCLKVEYNRGHIEGEMHRDKVITAAKDKEVE